MNGSKYFAKKNLLLQNSVKAFLCALTQTHQAVYLSSYNVYLSNYFSLIT